MSWRGRPRTQAAGLQIDQLRRLHRAELAVATAPSTYAAAKELADHALALLDAPVAVVLIEGAEESVRVVRGDAEAASVYEPGSRMRLFDIDGTPVGSIAVGPRCGGAYDARDEEVLDALAQRVSATLQRLSLFEAVQTERGSLADVLDSSSDAIAAVGPDFRVQAWNPAMARITGVAADDALGMVCCKAFKPVAEDGSPRFGPDACPCRTGVPGEELLAVGGPAGTRWLLTAFSPRAGGGTVVVARDVTARKQLDDEKADFLATVSHELRTPLTPLKGFIQTLVSRGEAITGAERTQVYGVLLREQQRLERLVDQLLRATTGDQVAVERSVPFDWTAVVRERVAAAGVVGEVDQGPAVVCGDPDALGLVLDELLSNAAKFTSAGEPVRVSLAIDAADGWVTTVVEDGGPGVPASDRERVFERFTRLGDHMTRPQQGVGLGLYIARRTVQAMGGTIDCEASEELGGAAFVLALPLGPAVSSPRS